MPSSSEILSRRNVLQGALVIAVGLGAEHIPLLGRASLSQTESGPRKELEPQGETAVFGLAFATTRDWKTALLLNPITGERREITLPPVQEPEISQGVFSPPGLQIAIARNYKDGQTAMTQALLVGTERYDTTILARAPLQRFGSIQTFHWSPGGDKIAVTLGDWNDKGVTRIKDLATGVALDRSGNMVGDFSPDSKWYAQSHHTWVELVRLGSEPDTRIISDVGWPRIAGDLSTKLPFAWSPDNKQIAFYSCTRSRGTGEGPICEQANLLSYNLKTGTSEFLTPADANQQIFFSPDGQRILFSQPESQGDNLAFYELSTGKMIPVDFSFVRPVEGSPVFFKFHSPEIAIFTGYRRGLDEIAVIWVDTKTGKVAREYKLPGYVEKVSSRDLIYSKGARLLGDPTELFLAPFTNTAGVLTGRRIGSFAGDINVRTHPSLHILGIVHEGDRIKTSDGSWIYKGGKRYQVVHPESEAYLGGPEEQLPPVLVRPIPEGEAITARPGDAVADSQNRVWYLRGEKKREVPIPTSLFMRNTRLDRDPRFQNGPLRQPQWVIDRIPVGASPKSGEWIHFNKKKISYQPHGGIMCVPLGGYGDNSDNQIQTFKDIMADYVSQGGNEAWVPDGTYHAEKNLRTNEIRLGPYNSDETKWRPPLNVTRGGWMMEFLGEINPGTRFIGIGYSLGGYILFNVALAHPDLFAAVITLDSPLKGINRAFWTPYGDRAVGFIGKDCAEYLVQLGDDPNTPERVENDCRQLQEHGVKVFPLYNEDDVLVRGGVASIESSDTVDFQGRPIQKGWRLGHTPIGGPKDILELATGHGQILRDRTVRNQVVRILL